MVSLLPVLPRLFAGFFYLLLTYFSVILPCVFPQNLLNLYLFSTFKNVAEAAGTFHFPSA